jgi:hypothetical protein
MAIKVPVHANPAQPCRAPGASCPADADTRQSTRRLKGLGRGNRQTSVRFVCLRWTASWPAPAGNAVPGRAVEVAEWVDLAGPLGPRGFTVPAHGEESWLAWEGPWRPQTPDRRAPGCTQRPVRRPLKRTHAAPPWVTATPAVPQHRARFIHNLQYLCLHFPQARTLEPRSQSIPTHLPPAARIRSLTRARQVIMMLNRQTGELSRGPGASRPTAPGARLPPLAAGAAEALPGQSRLLLADLRFNYPFQARLAPLRPPAAARARSGSGLRRTRSSRCVCVNASTERAPCGRQVANGRAQHVVEGLTGSRGRCRAALQRTAAAAEAAGRACRGVGPAARAVATAGPRRWCLHATGGAARRTGRAHGTQPTAPSPSPRLFLGVRAPGPRCHA